MATGTVTNTLKRPDGTAVAGATVQITLIAVTGQPGYTTSTSIVESTTVLSAADGSWSATLTCNADITPSGSYYRVVEDGTYTSAIQVVPGTAPLSALLVTAPAVTTPTLTGIQVATDGSIAGLERGINLVSGTNVTLAAVDNPAASRVDVTVSASGGGAGTPSGTVVAETSYGLPAVVGTATPYSRGDHSHGSTALASTAPTTSAVGDPAAVGTGTTPARADHLHAREAFGAPAAQTSYGLASVTGTASTVAHSDHAHGTPALTSAAAGTSAVADVAAAGTAITPARADHAHGREGFGAVVALAAYPTSATNGAATTLAHSDHVHGAPAIVDTSTVPIADAVPGAAGSATTASPRDHAHPRVDWRAADHGWLTWAYDVSAVTNSTGPVSGTLTLARVHLPAVSTITNVILYINTGGSTLTSGQSFAGLWTAAGTLVAVTADQSAAWTASASLQTMALAGGPYTNQPAGDYYVGWWSVGTTPPTFGRAAGQSVINGGLSAANSRFAAANTGLTTTAPGTLGAKTAQSVAWWAALS